MQLQTCVPSLKSSQANVPHRAGQSLQLSSDAVYTDGLGAWVVLALQIVLAGFIECLKSSRQSTRFFVSKIQVA